MQESEVTVDDEEVKSRKHNEGVINANMEDEEEYKDDVEMMGIKKELKGFSPYLRKGCSPQA